MSPHLTRRSLLGATAAAVATSAAVDGVALDPTAQAAVPPSGLQQIKHVVICMQENRSFDHYFGSLRGVRGFADRSTILQPDGRSVWQQPTDSPTKTSSPQFPWHLADQKPSDYPAGHQPPSSEVGAQNYGGTSHSWGDQHGAWNGGWMNGWVHAKGGPTTLGYLRREDIPFQYALADLYTIGDAYHCSVLSATGPNRTYLWSGTINASRDHDGDTKNVGWNGGGESGLTWQTYCEALEAAGVDWKVYQCLDNYGDNALEYFTQALTNPTLFRKGVVTVPELKLGETANADNLAAAIRKDVLAGTLPQVSWVVTNQEFSEHPDAAPDNGAYHVRKVMEALNADPDVFNSTLVIINYDENDGQFDHVPPPVAAAPEHDEQYDGGADPLLAELGLGGALPVGLGLRVPLLLLSPWTRGGWVYSEVADHTSVIQFLEQWTAAQGTPATCRQISAWRRRVCGDLTRAFDFTTPVFGMPALPQPAPITSPRGGSYAPEPANNVMPGQEPGTRPARALPYQPNANISLAGGAPAVALSNVGRPAAKASHFAIYDNLAGTPGAYPHGFPVQHTVDAGATAPGTVAVHGKRYDATVVGPNRFLRRFIGRTGDRGARVEVVASYSLVGGTAAITFTCTNRTRRPVTLRFNQTGYATGSQKRKLPRHGRKVHVRQPLAATQGWYDVTVTVVGLKGWSRRFVGHVETGAPSISG